MLVARGGRLSRPVRRGIGVPAEGEQPVERGVGGDVERLRDVLRRWRRPVAFRTGPRRSRPPRGSRSRRRARRQAASSAASASAPSTTTRTRARRASATRRSSRQSPTGGAVSTRSSMPSAAKPSASVTVATVSPVAPCSRCSPAIAGDLWVLAWGRKRDAERSRARRHLLDVREQASAIDDQRRRDHLVELGQRYHGGVAAPITAATPTCEALRKACGRSARKRIRSPWLSSWHSFSIRSSTRPCST